MLLKNVVCVVFLQHLIYDVVCRLSIFSHFYLSGMTQKMFHSKICTRIAATL